MLIWNAIEGRPIPLSGDGRHVRDWLFVDDHVRALWRIAGHARPGARYNIGARAEHTNLEVAHRICDLVDELGPSRPAGLATRRDLIEFVRDRPGHDRRCAIDPSRIESELGCTAQVSLDAGLRQTVRWYLDDLAWCREVAEAACRGRRLGVGRERS